MSGLVRGQVWLIPLLFALLVGGVGWTSYRALERATRDQLRTELETLLQADVTALRIWVGMQAAVVRDVAADRRVERLVQELIGVSAQGGDPQERLRAAPALAELRELLEPTMGAHGYLRFAAFDRFGLQVASNEDARVGRRISQSLEVIERALAGEPVVSRPMVLRAETAGELAGQPVIIALAPVRAPSSDEVQGVLGFATLAEGPFTEILRIARKGDSGETYAFDERGVMLSESRFDEDLAELGLLSGPGARSIMTVQIRDPGGSLVDGHLPELPLQARPLTRMAADAVANRSGSDVEGYRDYRGVMVVGAWTWLEDLGLGVATEIDRSEAYAGLRALQLGYWTIMGLLIVSALGMLVYSGVVVRMRSQVDRAMRLGRYRIESKIGEGGMGKVYLARHALLRRPTALKLLQARDADSTSVARFEREVQVTSGLSHPNTISIYDYGHTPEGIFYYAMEYLAGIHLGTCVEEDGPQPAARVVHIMRQVCGSIAEAHAEGLIHRDLKPSNIMLCDRGGLLDFVKVLDFGLVREEKSDLTLTNVEQLTGTPLYLSPEALQAPETIDPRADLYQLGGVAYYLVTGRHVFEGDSVVEILGKHMNATPELPSDALGAEVPKDLEGIILSCLEKDREQRPASATALLSALEACACADQWTQREAAAWWERWRAEHPEGPAAAVEPSYPSGYEVDFDERTG